MSVRDNLSTFIDGYKDVHKDDYYFSDATYDRIGKDEELTKFFLKQIDADGSKYGGDIEKAKNDFLNQYTFKSNSIVGSIKGALESSNYSEEEKQKHNFLQRMYDTAPNRLLGSEGFSGAAQALGYGLAGGLIGEGGGDLAINIVTSALTPFIVAGRLGVQGAKTALSTFGRKEAIAYAKKAIGEGATKSEIKAAIKQLNNPEVKQKLISEVAKKYAIGNAKAEFAVNGLLGGIGGLAEEKARENIGLSEGTFSDYAMTAGGGALMAGAIGGGLGYLTGRFGPGRQLGNELLSDSTKGQKIMSESPEGPRTYKEALKERIKELENKEKKSAEEIAAETAAKRELELREQFSLGLDDSAKDKLNQTIGSISNDLRQELNYGVVPGAPRTHSPEVMRAVADMLDDLSDFTKAEEDIYQAAMKMNAGAEGSREEYRQALTKWNNIKAINTYLKQLGYDESMDVRSLLDDDVFVDLATRLDERVGKALREPEIQPVQAPVTNSAQSTTSAQGAAQVDATQARKQIEAAIKENQNGKSAEEIVQLFIDKVKSGDAGIRFVTQEDLDAITPNANDVKAEISQESRNVLDTLSSKGLGDEVDELLDNFPTDVQQLTNTVQELSTKSGLTPEQITKALVDANSRRTTLTESLQQMKEMFQQMFNQKFKQQQEQATNNSATGTPTTTTATTTTTTTTRPKSRAQVVADAKKAQQESQHNRELSEQEKYAHIKLLSERVVKVREVFDTKANEVLKLIGDKKYDSLGKLLEDLPEEYRFLLEGVRNFDSVKQVIRENAQRYADYSILNTVRQVCGSSNPQLFNKFIPLLGTEKDTARLMQHMKNLTDQIHIETILETDGNAFEEALTEALQNGVIDIKKNGRKGKLDVSLYAEQFLPKDISIERQANAIKAVKRMSASFERNAAFKKLPLEVQNSIKMDFIEKRVKSYLANSFEYEKALQEAQKELNSKMTAVDGFQAGSKDGVNPLEELGKLYKEAKSVESSVDAENFLAERLNEKLGRYTEPVSLAPRIEETKLEAQYDASGKLIKVVRSQPRYDEQGNPIWNQRRKVVRFSLTPSVVNFRKGHDFLRRKIVAASSSAIASKSILEEARRVNPEGVFLLERKEYVKADGTKIKASGVTLKEAFGLIYEGMVDRLLEKREKLILKKLKENIRDGKEDLISADFDSIGKRTGLDFPETERAIFTEVARTQVAHEKEIAELSAQMQELFSREKLTGVEKVYLNRLLTGFDRMLREQGVIIDSKLQKLAKDHKKAKNERVTFNTSSSDNNLPPVSIDKKSLTLNGDEVTINGVLIGTVTKNEKGQYLIKTWYDSTLAPFKKLEDLLNRTKFMKKVQHYLQRLEAKRLEESGQATPSKTSNKQTPNVEGDEAPVAPGLPDGSGMGVPKSNPTSKKVEHIPSGLSNFEKELFVSAIRDAKASEAEAHLFVLEQRNKKTPEDLELIEKLKKQIEEEREQNATTAGEVAEDANENVNDQLNENLNEQGNNAKRTLADSLSLFTEDDLNRPISEYYALIDPQTQVIVARLEREDGSVIYRKIGLNKNNPDATIGSAIGTKEFRDAVDLGKVQILGAAKSAGKPGKSWYASNSFTLGGKGIQDKTFQDNIVTQQLIDERIKKLTDLGNDKGIVRLKALEHPLEEDDLAQIFFKDADGNEVDGLTFVNNFERECSTISIRDSINKETYIGMVERLASIAKQIQEKVPHGYFRKNSSRVNSTKNLITRMSGFNRSEQIGTLRILQQLGVAEGPKQYPYIYDGSQLKTSPAGYGFGLQKGAGPNNPNSDVVFLPKNGEAGGTYWSPGVAHELFHWGFSNILTPEEKVQFLRNVATKYFDEQGNFNVELAKEIATTEDSIRRADGNILLNELFAYEGTAYYGNKLVEQADAATDSFWEKLVSKFKDMLDWLLGNKENISPENAELFEKILPAEYNGSRHEQGLVFDTKKLINVKAEDLKGDGSNLGYRGLQFMNALEDHRSKLFKAMFDSKLTPKERLEIMKNSGNYLKGILHGSFKEKGSPFVKAARGKIIGYSEGLTVDETNRLVENELKVNNLLFKLRRNKEGSSAEFIPGTLHEVYKERYEALGAPPDVADKLAIQREAEVSIDEDLDSFYESMTLSPDQEIELGEEVNNEVVEYINKPLEAKDQDLDSFYESMTLSPDQEIELAEEVNAEVVKYINKLLEVKDEDPIDNIDGLKILEGVLSEEEYDDILDKMDLLMAHKRREMLGGINAGEQHSFTDTSALDGSSNVDTSKIQRVLGRLFDLVTDIEDSTVTVMRNNGYDVVPNRRFRDGIPPKGEGKPNTPKGQGYKTPQGNQIAETSEALNLLGSENGVPYLANPKLKAILHSYRNDNPEVTKTVRNLLYKYSQILGKDEPTLEDVAKFVDRESYELDYGPRSFDKDVVFGKSPFDSRATDLLKEVTTRLDEIGETLVNSPSPDTKRKVFDKLAQGLYDVSDAYGLANQEHGFTPAHLLEDVIKYLQSDEEKALMTRTGKASLRRSIKNLPTDITEYVTNELHIKSLDDIVIHLQQDSNKKVTDVLAEDSGGVKMSLTDLVQRAYDNRVPDDDNYFFTPLAGMVGVANEVGVGQTANEVAVRLAALNKGATPIQAEITSSLIPSKFREWYKNSKVQNLATKMNRGLDVLIASNQKRCRNIGAEFLTKAGEFFYEDHTVLVGKHFVNVDESLKKLRGTTVEGRSAIRNQIANDKEDILRNLMTNGHLGRISEAEKRVVDFMRTATNDNINEKWEKLSPQEKDAIRTLSKEFEAIRNEAIEVGLPVNDYRGVNGLVHYIPQRFNRDWVAANYDKFMDGMTRFFESEGQKTDRAKELAHTLYAHIVNDHEFAGFVGSDPTFARKSGEGLYQRVLNFKPEQWKEFGLTDMFDNNLESLAKDYFDHMATMIERAKRFGVEGHGRAAYFSVYGGGTEGAIAVLTNNKELKKTILKGESNARVAQAIETELFSALTTDKEEARQIVEMIDDALNKGTQVEDVVQTLVSIYRMRGGAGVLHFEREMNCLVNGIKDFGLVVGEKIDLDQSRYLVQASDILTGMRGAPKDDNAAIGWLAAFNNMSMLSMATIASFSDVALIGVRTGAVMPYLKGICGTIKMMANADPATRDAVRAVGVHIDGDRSQNFLNNSIGRMQGVNNAFFKANGLTQWTAFSRQIAANVGFEAVKCWQRQAREAIANGTQDSRTYRQAMFWLRRLGLNDQDFINGKVLTTYGDLMEAAKADPSMNSIYERVNRGVVKFVNESAFAPNRGDIPLWAQTGFGRLVYQFKSYPTMLGRLTRWAFESAKKENGRNFAPLAMLATLGVGMGAGGQALRDVIQGRNMDYEDDSQSFNDMHSVNYQKRLASAICKQMGWDDWADELDGTMADSIIGWYCSGLMGLGALGVVGDFIFGLTEEANNGTYGELNVAKQIFGPSFGNVMDLWHVGKTGFNMAMEGTGIKEERASNRDERRAFGAITSRVPLIGGVRSLNRELKDYLVPLEENR